MQKDSRRKSWTSAEDRKSCLNQMRQYHRKRSLVAIELLE